MGTKPTKAWNPSTDIPNLSGKVIIVTGANAGIGYATTVQLAHHGAKVYLATRSETRAHAAIAKMHATNPGIQMGKLVFLPLDLADFSSIVKAAELFLGLETRLDVLINNAATLTWDYQVTRQGFERVVGVNYLGHFLLTTRLLPLLTATALEMDADVRIVNLTSAGHAFFMPPLTFTTPSDFHYPGPSPSPPSHAGFRNQSSRSAVSQSMRILFTSELQRRLTSLGSPILVTCLSPGGVATEGQAAVRMGWFAPVWWVLKRVLSRSSEEGARPVGWLAVGKEVRGVEGAAGGYFGEDCTVRTPGMVARDGERARALWALSEEVVGEWEREEE